MEINSYNKRETQIPKTDIPRIEVSRYDVKEMLDDSGISHSSVIKQTKDDFLDVPFRDYSMATFVATGEVTRLRFVSPQHDNSLDMYDRITGDFTELSAKVDHMEMMESVKASVSEEK